MSVWQSSQAGKGGFSVAGDGGEGESRCVGAGGEGSGG